MRAEVASLNNSLSCLFSQLATPAVFGVVSMSTEAVDGGVDCDAPDKELIKVARATHALVAERAAACAEASHVMYRIVVSES